MKRPARRIARQISAAALGIISVVALLLSAGLIMYTGNGSDPALTTGEPPYSEEEIIVDPNPPLAPPDEGISPAVAAICVLVGLAFVLVWFLVFRPEGAAPSPGRDIPPLPVQDSQPG